MTNQHGSGNSADDPKKASEAGRKGGQISRGGRGRLIASPADMNSVTGVSVSGAEPRRAD